MAFRDKKGLVAKKERKVKQGLLENEDERVIEARKEIKEFP